MNLDYFHKIIDGMPTIIENIKINSQVFIFFLIDLNIGHCVELPPLRAGN